MKIIAAIIISALFLTSCSLILGGIVALDNEIYAGEKVIENYKEIKPNQKIKIVFLNKTSKTGLFKSVSKANGENLILIKNDKEKNRHIYN